MNKKKYESIYNVDTKKVETLTLCADSSAMGYGAYLKHDKGGL